MQSERPLPAHRRLPIHLVLSDGIFVGRLSVRAARFRLRTILRRCPAKRRRFRPKRRRAEGLRRYQSTRRGANGGVWGGREGAAETTAYGSRLPPYRSREQLETPVAAGNKRRSFSRSCRRQRDVQEKCVNPCTGSTVERSRTRKWCEKSN